MKSAVAVSLTLIAFSAAAAPSKKALETQLDAYVAPFIEQNVFSGVVLVAKGDEVLVNRAYGNANEEFAVPNTPSTRFPID